MLYFRFKYTTSTLLQNHLLYSIRFDTSEIFQGYDIDNLKHSYESELELFHTSWEQYSTSSKLFEKYHKIVTNFISDEKHKKMIQYDYHTSLQDKYFYTMNAITLFPKNYEYENMNYFVTDKIDGLKIQLIITPDEIKSIDINNNIQFVTKNNSQIKTFAIIETEHILKDGIHYYYAYDILYEGQTDLRNQKYTKRLAKLYDLLQYDTSIQKTLYSTRNLSKQIQSYLQYSQKTFHLNNIHILVKGIFHVKSKTLFKESDEIYNQFLQLYPKEYPDIDGIIFTHANQIYEKIFSKIQHPTFKWKPVHLSTIDFFIRIIGCSNDQFNIELYNYDSNHMKTLFSIKNTTNFWVHNKDSFGNEIVNETVVEALYDTSINEWKIIKTRNDKTLFCKTYNKKWGNHIDIARDIFDYVLYGSSFYKVEKQEYHDPLGIRITHNFIKSFMIHKYCRHQNVIDIGSGEGGDLTKFLSAPVHHLIMSDINSNDLLYKKSSAYHRYEKLKKQKKYSGNKREIAFEVCDFSNDIQPIFFLSIRIIMY